MNLVLVGMLLGLCLAMMVWGLVRRGGVYQYPFLIGAIVFAFVLPQLPGLAIDPYLPEGTFAKAMLVIFLCVVMAHVGWIANRRPLQHFRWHLDDKKLVIAAACLSVVGAVFYYKFTRLPDEVRSMTGTPVVYLFLAKLLGFGFATAVFCWFKSRSWAALAVAAFDSLFYLDRIVFAGRRAEAGEIVMIILLAFWFQRRRAIPGSLAIVGIFCAMLMMTSTGDYRRIAGSDAGLSWGDVSEIDLMGNLENLMNSGGSELRNFVYKVHLTDRYMIFDYGAFHWNYLVFHYLPSQIVGSKIKSMFLLPTSDVYALIAYNREVGTTETGFADAFGSFWYFGCMKFFIIGFFMRRVYLAAMEGWMPAQICFALTLIPSLLVVTHHTQELLSAWVQIAMFLLPALLLARKRAARGILPARPLQQIAS